MPIITISRGSYSRGKEVAEKLALKLGYECISREVLLDASDEFNIPEIKLIRALHDAPSVLDRFFYGKERFISYIHSALLQQAKSDNIVYHGLAGHYFFRNIPHVLKVRIIADIEDRVKEEMKRENISAEKALYLLNKDDEERRRWGLELYGLDTWDSRLYDMVLYIQKLTVDDVVDILVDTVQKPIFQATPASRQLVENLALEAKIKANLATIEPRAVIAANDGDIHISNIEKNIERSEGNKGIAQIEKILMQIDGVKKVTFEIKSHREQRNHVNPFQNIG
jgi:cytidylate kinase